MLFSLGPFNFDFWMLLSFLMGLAFGLMIFALVYLYAVIHGLNKGLRLRQADEEDIDEEEIKWLIKSAQTEFKDTKLRKEIGYGKYLTQITKSLAFDIAAKFYPESKYPYLELTVDEILVLMRYVSQRLDELLSRKLLKLFRGLTLSRLLTLNDKKEKIIQNEVVKTGLRASKIASKVLGVINLVNPIYWVRKGIIDNVTKVILVKLGLAVISITGEETYKIYSKKVFNRDVELTTDVDQLYAEIEAELKGAINEKK